jgi:hypothetical protein
MQQVIAKVFSPNASFQRSWRFSLLLPCMAHATGHRQGLLKGKPLRRKRGGFVF